MILQPANADSQAYPEKKLYDNANPSVFTIYSVNEANEKKSALGCAVAVSEHLLATNYHVALAGNYLVVEVNNKSHLGRIFYYNQAKDLCIIEVVGTTLKPANIRPSSTVSVGEEVYAIGNAGGVEKQMSKGVISDEKIEGGMVTRLQTDAHLAPGSSGGGLFDKEGNLVGITFGGDIYNNKIGFALPTEFILQVIKSSNQLAENNNSSPSTDTNTSNNFNLIGSYGKNKIALYQHNKKCFIAITGDSTPKQNKSLAIWYPNDANGLFIFPDTASADSAIKNLQNTCQGGTEQYNPSKSFLQFGKNIYELTKIEKSCSATQIYIYVSDINIDEKLLPNTHFSAQIDDVDATHIDFNLDGFPEALEAYHQSCQ